MVEKTYCINLLLENATSFTEKAKIHALTEAEQAVVNDRMVGSLYQSVLNKKDINFDNIPFSKGDVKKVEGYDNMVATLETIRGLAHKFGMKIGELDIVESALVNLRTNRPAFERGFALNNEFMILYYNTLVYACIEATSLILASYVEYVKTLNNVEFRLRKGKGVYGNLCLSSLDKFNKSVKDGSFNKFVKGMNERNRDNFLGGGITAAGLTAAGVAAGVVSAVAIARTLVFKYYDGRMSLADKLQQQSLALEINKFSLDAKNMDAQQRNKILNKQKAVIDKLERLSDKITVDSQISDNKANGEIKSENKGYTLNSVSGNSDDYLFL